MPCPNPWHPSPFLVLLIHMLPQTFCKRFRQPYDCVNVLNETIVADYPSPRKFVESLQGDMQIKMYSNNSIYSIVFDIMSCTFSNAHNLIETLELRVMYHLSRYFQQKKHGYNLFFFSYYVVHKFFLCQKKVTKLYPVTRRYI